MTAVRPVAVIGPTAAGKSDLALDLAERLGGQIVNIDAMQLYRGMDIGTAKLPADRRRGIVHHQLDVLDVTETATVARYQRAARADVEAIAAGGSVPVIVGGSMMYVQALLDDWEFPATDPGIRARWEAVLAERGTAGVHEELARVDPQAAATILPTDGRRMVRALEVVELTGAPFAASAPTIGAPRWGTVILGSTATPWNWTRESRSAPGPCSRRGWSARSSPSSAPACGTVPPPPGRSGTRRCCPGWTVCTVSTRLANGP